jgi:hypothetical protein
VHSLFLESSARWLVLAHAMAAMVAVGAGTHQLVVAVGHWRGRPRIRLARVYAPVVAVAYFATMALGALAYPVYRYRVRGLFLDRWAVWASNLFDIKENAAALALPFVVAAWVLGRKLDGETPREAVAAYAIAAAVAAAVVWFAVISGLLITLERGV